jgi:hypothetical protein
MRERRESSGKARKAERLRHLEKLKKQWLELGQAKLGSLLEDERLDERNALARRSANLLLCSEEMIKLIEFLAKHNISSGVRGMPVGELFRSSRAAEAREMLLELSSKTNAGGWEYREIWSKYAGQECSEDEFDAFYSAMVPISARSAQEALFGRNEYLAKTDPEEAVSSTIRELEKNVDSPNRGIVLTRVMDGLPRDADFKKIEEMLSRFDFDPSPWGVMDVRLKLFESWSLADPEEAADYVMSHSDRLNTKLIGPCASAVMGKRGVVAGIEWIGAFSEGPYRDALAENAIVYLQIPDPEAARRVAALIGDSERRKQALQRIARLQMKGNEEY